MRALPAQFQPYGWALSTAVIARTAGIEPREALRFDGNVPPHAPAPARPQPVAGASAVRGPGAGRRAARDAPRMGAVAAQFQPDGWAGSTAEIARIAGIEAREVLRFVGNVPPDTAGTVRPGTGAAALEDIRRF